MKIKVLINFERTGKEVTNAVWTPGSNPFGEVQPKTCRIDHTFLHRGKSRSATLLVVGWNIARVEKEERYGDVGSSNEDDDNAVDRDLNDSNDDAQTEGMGM